MKNPLRTWSFLSLGLCICSNLFTQDFTISGFISSNESGEKLIGANIMDLRTGKGTVSNTYGFYSLTLAADTVVLRISYTGYQTVEHTLSLQSNQDLDFQLIGTVELKEVKVVATEIERIEESTQMSRVQVPIEQIKKVPALLGEVDVLKVMQLLPGIQSGGEGQTGIYVRGGSPDQNLILLDGVPVYNASHVAGLFSVFNPDAINNTQIYKGAFPARFGGRLSSVLEINMKEGNNQKFHAEGSIGLITSKLTLEGPLKKGKTSFLLSGRRTYFDLLARPFVRRAVKDDGVDLRPKAHFYDLNAKINHIINEKHKVFLSLYNGSDVLFSRVKEEGNNLGGGLDWGNWISSARWNWQLSPKVFSNTTLIYSNYQFDARVELEEERPAENFKLKSKYISGIRDLGIRWDLDYLPRPEHYLRFGFGATAHRYDPGALSFKLRDDEEDVNLDTLIGTQQSRSKEFYAYAEDDIDLGALKFNLGVHISAFGVDDVLYNSVQPRLSFRYLMANRWAVKASVNTMTQYINLLATEALTLPTDLWVPSTRKVKPQRAWQAAAGVAKSFAQFEFSLEAYYKKMHQVVSFKPGSNFLFGLDNDWEEKITQGKGFAYGFELFLQKKVGKSTGWIGYTLSWNKRQFDEIEGGEIFPFKYDRRHDLALVLNHTFNPRVSLSASWVYGTGNAITLPIEKYNLGYSYGTIQGLGPKNAFRMSDYHRLDLGVQFSKQKRRHTRTWSFGAYNSYAHKNPYFIFSGKESVIDQSNGQIIEEKQQFKEVSILPFLVPYFSYAFKF